MKQNSMLELYPPYAYIKFAVLDNRSDSLKIKLDVMQPRQPPDDAIKSK
jgi:hypothetical protein